MILFFFVSCLFDTILFVPYVAQFKAQNRDCKSKVRVQVLQYPLLTANSSMLKDRSSYLASRSIFFSLSSKLKSSQWVSTNTSSSKSVCVLFQLKLESRVFSYAGDGQGLTIHNSTRHQHFDIYFLKGLAAKKKKKKWRIKRRYLRISYRGYSRFRFKEPNLIKKSCKSEWMIFKLHLIHLNSILTDCECLWFRN